MTVVTDDLRAAVVRVQAGDTSWLQAAACRGMSPDVFFPPRGRPEPVRAAVAVCAECPVRDDCLADAVVSGEWAGIRGGLTSAGRRGLASKLGAVRRSPIPHGTETGYNRHRQNGEAACAACLEAKALADRERYERRRGGGVVIPACDPVVERDGTSWGIWCDWCRWGVAGLDSRRTADQTDVSRETLRYPRNNTSHLR